MTKRCKQVTPFLPYIKLFNTALLKLLRPVEQNLWRGVDVDLYDLYHPKIGKKITFWGYTSTTIEMDTLEQFIPPTLPKRTLFSIRASHGADLRPFSAFKNEAEVLLPACTMLEVKNVKRMSENLTIVELNVVKNLLGCEVKHT